MNETLTLPSSTSLSFADTDRFDHIQRVARMFADSQLVPVAFQKNIPNVVIALEIAQRIGASALMVMQNLNIIHGKPSFGSSFMIATVNACSRFTPLRFVQVGERNSDDWGCYAIAKAKVDGAECRGVTVTMGIAKAEGWIGKTGSKWKTMPELMLQYRAATWWVRMFAPELLMGFPTSDEVIDVEAFATPDSISATAPERKSRKGVAAAKAEADIPASEPPASPVTPAAENVAATPASEPASAPVDRAPQPAPTATAAIPDAPKKLRCEIVDVEEKQAKKAGGVGPVCTVTLKGEFAGIAYFDGAATALPSLGAVCDVVLEERTLKDKPVKVITALEVLA